MYVQGDHIWLDKQVVNHISTVARITMLLGFIKSREHLKKCIYTVGIGSNDYLNNYFLPQYYSSSLKYTPDQFAQLLIQHYSLQLRVITTTFSLN